MALAYMLHRHVAMAMARGLPAPPPCLSEPPRTSPTRAAARAVMPRPRTRRFGGGHPAARASSSARPITRGRRGPEAYDLIERIRQLSVAYRLKRDQPPGATSRRCSSAAMRPTRR